MSNETERKLILKMISAGQITPVEGVNLLNALDDGDGDELESPAIETAFHTTEPSIGPSSIPIKIPISDPDHERWKNWWQIPMWLGIGLAVFGALLMFAAWQTGRFSFWFACAWFPFLLGLAVMLLAWSSRNLHWVNLRLRRKPGEWPRFVMENEK